jgi:hypothetical protein
MQIVPTLGRVVWYVFSALDAEKINRRRKHASDNMGVHITAANGVMLHVGNDVHEGDKAAAIVVAVHGEQPDSYVNLKVMLDGSDDYWATSVKVSDGAQPGAYHWMPYQVGQAKKHEGGAIAGGGLGAK